MPEILVIEDQCKRFQTILDMLADMLEETQSGYSLIRQSNWSKALEIYAERHKEIKLVILDVRMPAVYKDEMERTPDGKLVPRLGIDRDEKQFNYGRTTGLEVYRRIKEIDGDQEILFWTVLRIKEIIDEGIPVDDQHYMGKDSDYAAFLESIDKIIGTELFDYYNDIMLDEGQE